VTDSGGVCLVESLTGLRDETLAMNVSGTRLLDVLLEGLVKLNRDVNSLHALLLAKSIWAQNSSHFSFLYRHGATLLVG
jgi:hypothetical protein